MAGKMSTSNMTSQKNDGESTSLQFPWKLHRMLDDSEEKGFSDVISWMPEGRSFKVHSKARFTAEVMPLYYESCKFKSFQRSLNLWGFRTMPNGPRKGECTNPFLLRGQADLCVNMQRIRVRGVFSRAKKHNNPESQAITSTIPSTAPNSMPSFTAKSDLNKILLGAIGISAEAIGSALAPNPNVNMDANTKLFYNLVAQKKKEILTQLMMNQILSIPFQQPPEQN